MRPLADLERLLERLLERPSARLFRTRLQPIQVQRRVERAMERERRTGADRIRVPDRYTVHLSPPDLAGLGGAAPEIAAELADAALVFARARGYTLAARPEVTIVADDAVHDGDIVVVSAFRGEARLSAPGPASDEDAADRTMVFAVPAVRAPAAVLREIRRDGSDRVIPIDGTLLTIGRAEDNGLVLPDTRVSRHHARLRSRHGMLVLSDLDSTNGVRVNGVRVSEAALGVGDRIEIGETVLVVETISPD